MRSYVALLLGFALTASVSTLAQAQKEITLYSFTGAADGYLPFGGLKFDSSGKLYGSNFFGSTVNGSCPAGCGSVFQLIPSGSSWTFKTLHSFSGGPSDVGHSYAHVSFDSAGNLYGTGSNGGANSNCYTGTCGGVFKLTKSSAWSESVIYSFAKTTGLVPYTGLTLYKGSFYGATQFGPSTKTTAGHGEIYKLTSGKGGKWSHSTLYEFTGASDGYEPAADLVFDTTGNLYGSALYSGSGPGTIFELSKGASSWTLELIDAANASTMIFDKSGNLYGSFPSGGSLNCTGGCGSVFELEKTSTGWNQVTLYEFTDATDGFEPGALVFDSNGDLFGTTFLGGTGSCQFFQYPGCGTVFKLTNTNGVWNKTTLYNFTGGSDGEFPNGNALVLDSAGNLFGATTGGATYGSTGYGTVYEIQP